jgi:GTP-dependent phosphoenolpyruvate carboxykinase
MKQTAVEWLVEQLEGDDSKIARVIGLKKYNSIIKEAKEMEKEQMKLSRVPIAYENKSWQGLMERHFEQWYNETFKSK